MLRNMTKPKSNRIETLQKQLNWLEQHCHYINRLNHRTNNNNDNDIGVVKQIKAELAELQEEDAAYDKLRSLSLYSCKITGFKFVCSSCYDKVYMFTIAKQRF
jgi:hypothetical protein